MANNGMLVRRRSHPPRRPPRMSVCSSCIDFGGNGSWLAFFVAGPTPAKPLRRPRSRGGDSCRPEGSPCRGDWHFVSPTSPRDRAHGSRSAQLRRSRRLRSSWSPGLIETFNRNFNISVSSQGSARKRQPSPEQPMHAQSSDARTRNRAQIACARIAPPDVREQPGLQPIVATLGSQPRSKEIDMPGCRARILARFGRTRVTAQRFASIEYGWRTR